MPRLIWIVWAVSFLVGAGLTRIVRRRLRRQKSDQPDKRQESLGRKFLSYLAIVGGILALGELPQWAFALALLILGSVLVGELWEVTVPAPDRIRYSLRKIGVLWIVCGTSSCVATGLADPTGRSWGLLWLIVATNDGYAQLIGQGWGRRRLAPRLSPAKTWEGLVGGAGIAGLVGLAQLSLHPGLSAWQMFMTAVLTGLAASGGDLLESAGKRTLGVKDSSALLGLHGGLLDRFDSLLFAAPVFVILRRIL